MDHTKRMVMIEYITVAAILIASGFTSYKLVGMLIVIAYMIAERIIRKRTKDEVGFNFKTIPKGIKETWVYFVLVVLVAPVLTVLIGKCFVPDYFSHVLARVTPVVDPAAMNKLFIQLLIMAFGEEIVFRAFLQGRLSLFIKPSVALILPAIVFAALHYTPGVIVVVVMDLLSVFVDGLLFGIIFRKSNNVYVSTIAHFLGNSFGMLILIAISKGLF